MEQRASLSVVVIGDAGSGKSTLVGHLAVKINAIAPREAEKMEKDCLAAGAGREKRFAWLLDRSQQVSALRPVMRVPAHGVCLFRSAPREPA